MANSAGTDQVPALFAMVEDELEQRLGSGSIYSGLTVTTTLNIGVQRAAEGAYAAGFDPGGLEADEAGRRPTGALVALDPGTGGVRAVVGGPDGEQINLAADNRRQPGSTFKLFALAAWLEQGRSADSYFDAPAVYTIPNLGDGQDYEVHNYGGSGHGEMSLRDATWQSVNTVYAQVWEQVGSPAFIDAARAAGREGVEGLGHLQGADRRGAEHQRRVAGGKVRVDAGGAGGVDEGRRADLLPDLGVDGVDRRPGSGWCRPPERRSSCPPTCPAPATRPGRRA